MFNATLNSKDKMAAKWEEITLAVFMHWLRMRKIRSNAKIPEIGMRIRVCELDGYCGDWPVFWDTKNGILLRCEHESAACIGFDEYGTGLLVEQIQGVPGTEEYLRLIPWKEMLLDATMIIASACGFSHVVIQRAEANRYYRTLVGGRATPPDLQKRLRAMYDDFPKTFGFVPGVNGNLIRELVA